jgi:membrane protease subunit HflK
MMRWGWLVLLLVLLGYALTGVVQVLPGERAVVRRFGRVLEERPEPGLWIGLPWGMDRVDRVAVDRVQSVTVGYQEQDGSIAMPAGQMLTGDHNLVNVQATLYFKVQPEEVVDYVIQADRIEPTLGRVAESVLAEWVAGRTVDAVLLAGKRQMPAYLVQKTQERLAPYRLGVQILDARVGLITPPDEVKPAFDNVARAQTTIATLINKAEQEADSRRRTAEADCYRIAQLAAADAHSRTLLAQREAESFRRRLDEYQRGSRDNPLYLRQIWEEERGKLLTRLKENKQLGLLDHHLGPDGLDLTIAPPLPQK